MEVESEVTARAEALARRNKPLSHVIPACSRRYAVADDPLFAASLPVNPSFAQLAGGQVRGAEALALHFLFGDGGDGAFVPDSTGDDVFVSLV